MQEPKFDSTGLAAIRQQLIKENKLRSLDSEEHFPVIPTGCRPLNWVTDCGGIPRGRVVVVMGPESSGKCVTLDSIVPVFGQGLLSFRELAQQVQWKTNDVEVVGDQHVPLDLRVPGANGEPVHATDLYFAGGCLTNKIVTEDGHELTGAQEHRVLCLTARGYLSYTPLRDLRVGQIIVKSIGHCVTGNQTHIFDWELPSDTRPLTLKEASTVALLGALCGAEVRDGSYYLLVTHVHQMNLVRQWARDLFEDENLDVFDRSVLDFSRFSGLVRICDGKWVELVHAATEQVPLLIRKASLTAQAHWCAGLMLARGTWTQFDLEFEIQNAEVARTLHLLLENIGIRSLVYPTLNTFGIPMTKVAIKNRLAQQVLDGSLFQGYVLPPDWKGCSVKEEEETHPYVRESLLRAREVLEEDGYSDLAESVDIEDFDKENLLRVGELLFPLARRKKKVDRVYETLILLGSPNIYLDRVTYSKSLNYSEPLMDLRVPIGSHYAANGLISHNSTLALHLANQELQNNPQSVVVYQDFEHSMLIKYAARIVNKKYSDRFVLLSSDVFEETDKYLLRFFKAKVFPSLWIIDSVPAMVPKAMFSKFSQADEEDEDKVKGVGLGLQARLFSEGLARWVKVGGTWGTTFLLLNQIRANIQINKFQKGSSGGRMSPGVPESGMESTPGGFALKFYNSMTLDLRPRISIKAKVENPYMGGQEVLLPVAASVQVSVRKNKCGAPHRQCMMYIQFGEGIDEVRTLFDQGIRKNLIQNPSKGRFAVQLPDGTYLSVLGQENFIDALKGKDQDGTAGLVAAEYLKKLLGWDRADELHSQVLGIEEEDLESGEVSSLEPKMGDVDPQMLDYVRSRQTFIEKADALGMIVRRAKSVYWTNPETREEFRGLSLDKLFEKLEEKDETTLIRLVMDKIKHMESLVLPVEPAEEFAKAQVQPFPANGADGDAPFEGVIPDGEAPLEVLAESAESFFVESGEAGTESLQEGGDLLEQIGDTPGVEGTSDDRNPVEAPF